MAHGRLIEMGQLTTIDQDGSKTEYKMALVIEFPSTDEIRKAIKDGKCDFTWGEIPTTPNVELRGCALLRSPVEAEGRNELERRVMPRLNYGE